MSIKSILYVLGKILFIEALLMLLPLTVSIIYGDGSLFAYIITTVILFAISTPSIIFKLKKPVIRAREGLVITGFAWIAVSLFGALPFCISGDIPNYLDALFETVSGFTTTGSTILSDIEALSPSNLFWRSFSHWIGGMGVLVFALAILPGNDTQSMHLMRAEVPGPQVGKLVSKIRLTARLLYVLYIALTVIEAVYMT